MEQWKPVIGWEDRYEVSDLGRVRSLRANKILTPKKHYKGYQQVQLWRANKPINHFIHALVLEAFKGTRPRGKEILHTDGVATNNQLNNLSYGTPFQNAKDKIRHGTLCHGERCHFATITTETAKAIRALKGSMTQTDIGGIYGVSQQLVSDIHTKRTWKHV